MFLALIWWGMRWQTDCFWRDEEGQLLYCHKATIWWDLLCQEALGQLNMQSFRIKHLFFSPIFSLHMLRGTVVLGHSSQDRKMEGTGCGGSSHSPCLLFWDICAWSGYCLQMSHHIKHCDLAPLLTSLRWEAKAEIRVDLGFVFFFLKVVGVMKVVRILSLFLL